MSLIERFDCIWGSYVFILYLVLVLCMYSQLCFRFEYCILYIHWTGMPAQCRMMRMHVCGSYSESFVTTYSVHNRCKYNDYNST